MACRISFLATVSISGLALWGNDALAGEAWRPVAHMRGEVHRVISAVPGAATLYDQNSGDSGVAVLSTNFTHDLDSYDSYGADDFAVPSGHRWKIREVEVTGGYGQNSNPAQSENILFYKDAQGLPGPLVANCTEIAGTDNSGSFAIKIPKSCKVTLKGGFRYWVSVVANENNVCCTVWVWETGNAQNGNPAAWENPARGFRQGCPEWGIMTSCLGNYGEGPDFMFALKGRDVVR